MSNSARALGVAALCSLAGCWADFPASRLQLDVDTTPDQRSDTAARDGAPDALPADALEADAPPKDALQTDAPPDALQPDTTVSLPVGSSCVSASQCASTHCECRENSAGCAERICCAIACPSGEACKANGKLCQ